MLIAQFCERTGLTRDTVRFYVRKGLLEPNIGAGTNNRYQTFSEVDVEQAMMIRNGQALGFTLREMLALKAESTPDGMTVERQAALMRERITAIDGRITALRGVRDYLERKITWLDGGAVGPAPSFMVSVH